ncbi:acetamidase/formamidase family protein [Specibacter cremeus]|uniref:acetamidase/formamidase family protein n=1 Tax=Specibacter cremeus TaxID=1629051 RepID=UPI0013DDA0C5|nr:acetamidase/formamidase family protein [Specibacter cremeus]
MEIAELGDVHAHTKFRADVPPALSVAQGETFALEALSILGPGRTALPTSYQDLVIPVTGPVAIDGVLAGDTVRIDIVAIDIAEVGAMVTLPGHGLFGAEVKVDGKILPIENDRVVFAPGVEIPVAPMLGKIGMAVPGDAPVSSTVGHFGGNMDNKHLGAGASIYLRAQVDGGMVYAGDLHACQADGESSMTAVEVAGRVTLRARVVPKLPVAVPVVVTSQSTMTIGAGDSLEGALVEASTAMLTLLRQTWGWSRETAVMALSLIGDVGVCQLVNPRVSGKVTVPSKYISDLNNWVKP